MLALFQIFALFAVTSKPPAAIPAPASAMYSPLDACAAVTRFDVQDALRRTIGPGDKHSVAGASVCDYAAGAGQVTISLQRITGIVDVRAEAESLRTVLPDATLREAPDRYGQAFYLHIPGAGTQFYLIRGSGFVLVSILGCGEGSGVSLAARELALKALASQQRDDSDLPH